MTTTTFEPGTLHQVPPGELLLERNIRDSQPDAALIASVKEVGVLQPITAVLNADGRLVVRFGQRRTLAAVEAGRDTVPVYVTGSDDTADKAEIDRIVRQRDENTHRAGLTASDELHVVEQLAAFGLSAAQIAKRTRIKRTDVDVALKVTASDVAREAAAVIESLTLDQVAAIAEFEDDPEVVEVLTATAKEEPHQFAHVAQRARDERTSRQQHAALVAELEKAGVKVVDQPDYQSKTLPLHRLRDAKGKELTEATHKACPGHVAWIVQFSRWGDSGERVQVHEARFGCTDFKRNGHTDSYSSSTNKKADDMSEEEREKAKAARRLVIDNNKAWDSAEVVRREWLAEFAQRKTAAKGTAAFVLETIAHDHGILNDKYDARSKLLMGWGVPTKAAGYYTHVDVGAATTDPKALHLLAVEVVAAHEAAMDRTNWRQNGKTSRCGRYLRFLQAAGYTLSDVEKFALNTKTVA